MCSRKFYLQYLCSYWWPNCMMPEKVTWVRFSSGLSTVFSKLPPISDDDDDDDADDDDDEELFLWYG